MVNTVQDLSTRGVGLRVLAGQGAQIDKRGALGGRWLSWPLGRQRDRHRRSTCLRLAVDVVPGVCVRWRHARCSPCCLRDVIAMPFGVSRTAGLFVVRSSPTVANRVS